MDESILRPFILSGPDADFVTYTWKNTAELILYLIFKETAVEKDKL